MNVENMINKSKGDFAYTLIETAGGISEDELKGKLGSDEFIRVRVIK